MRVTIIGLGGIGSRLADLVAQYLASLDARHALTLIDGDAFDEKNRSRQLFDKLGSKAPVVAERLARLYPELELLAVAEYLTEENVDFLLVEDEIVLVGVDNHATRKLISQTAGRRKNVSVISGGNDLTDGTVQVYIRRQGCDVTPSLTQDHPEIASPTDKSPHQMSCEELARSGTPQIIFANATAAALMANAFWLLCQDPEAFSGRAYSELAFDIGLNRVLDHRFRVTSLTTTNATQGGVK